jgi:hypothetical protein
MGKSQSGKSTYAELFEQILSFNGYASAFPAKYICRPKRVIEDKGTVNVDVLPKNCDLHWETNGHQAGYDTAEIEDLFNKDVSPILICSDATALEQIKKQFGFSDFRDKSNVAVFRVHGNNVKESRSINDYVAVEKERNPNLTENKVMLSAKKRFLSALEIGKNNNTNTITSLYNPVGTCGYDDEETLQRSTQWAMAALCENCYDINRAMTSGRMLDEFNSSFSTKQAEH